MDQKKHSWVIPQELKPILENICTKCQLPMISESDFDDLHLNRPNEDEINHDIEEIDIICTHCNTGFHLILEVFSELTVTKKVRSIQIKAKPVNLSPEDMEVSDKEKLRLCGKKQKTKLVDVLPKSVLMNNSPRY